jgi:hypothetical protein
VKYQSTGNYKADVRIMTPPALAKAIVEHFVPTGLMMEPCRGDGAFFDLMPGAEWCEIDEGRDFFDYDGRVEWIVTNPPWGAKGNLTGFMDKAFKVSDNVVFLMTINHAWTHARLRLLKLHGFYIAEIATVAPWPASWPSSGLQLGAVHWKRGPSPGHCLSSAITWSGDEAAPPKKARSPMSRIVTLDDMRVALAEVRTVVKHNGWLNKLLSKETKAVLRQCGE